MTHEAIKETALSMYKVLYPHKTKPEEEVETMMSLCKKCEGEFYCLTILSRRMKSRFSMDLKEVVESNGFDISDVYYEERDENGALYVVDFGPKGYMHRNNLTNEWKFNHQPTLWS